MALQELEVERVKKGNNFVVNDKKQLCRYVFHMLQDPIARNGQKNHSFWGWIIHQVTTQIGLLVV
jgi:hypothetical protein